MPWTPEEFKAKHAHALTDDQAAKACAIANAMLKSGAADGIAIATGIKRAKEMAAVSSSISIDVELLIKLLEWAREEAGNDVDLHIITEHLEALSEGGNVLTMADYPEIIGVDHREPTTPSVATYSDEKTIVVKYVGDFNLPGLLTHLNRLGNLGCSRAIKAEDSDENDVNFGFDGDGADKITHVTINGEPIITDGQPVKPQISVARLAEVYRAESRASDWWDKMNTREKKAYIRAHPHSKYAKSGGTVSTTPAKKPPTSTFEAPARKRVPKGANKDLHDHLMKTGWEFRGDHYAHPTSKNKLTFRPPTDMKHHLIITKANGDVVQRKTNSDARAQRIVSMLSRKPKSTVGATLAKDKGSLHEHLGVEKGKKIPEHKLEKLAKSDHPLARRAQLVLNLNRARRRGPVEYEPAR